MTTARKLGNIELLLHLLGVSGAQICMSIIQIEGEILLDEVKEAMLYLQQRHPFLNVVISETQPST